jgi:hypothetical protein
MNDPKVERILTIDKQGQYYHVRARKINYKFIEADELISFLTYVINVTSKEKVKKNLTKVS